MIEIDRRGAVERHYYQSISNTELSAVQWPIS